MITLNKTMLRDDGAPNPQLLACLLEKHGKGKERMDRLHDMYNRKHKIENRMRMKGLPNNKLAHDLPGYIVTMSAGYLVGNPINYTPPKGSEASYEPIKDALKAAVSDNVDAELAVDAAVYGKGIEICYADEQSCPRIAQVDPIRAFVVYDDSVEHLPLFGVTVDDIFGPDLKPKGERVAVYTPHEIITHESSSVGGVLNEVKRQPHFFSGVPLIEYWNNSREEGDFEPVVDLIDAYDALQSDRVNDKQQFTDSILALYGVGGLGTDEGESEDDEENSKPQNSLTPSQRLRQTKTLFMPADGSKAEWLVKPASESDSEILRKSLKDDIHKLCMVPDLTDENFAGNVSGVAMRFKLLGLEQLTKIKERWFREGLRQRLRLFSAFLSVRGAAAIDVDKIQISFKRSLPVNETEIASMVSSYEGKVSNQTLLGQVPFVDDPKTEMALLQQERQQAIQNQQALVGNMPFRESGQTKETTQEDDGQ